MKAVTISPDQSKLWRIAMALAILTIVYNTAEGLIATWYGWEDETLALFGFGVDSFIETLSGIGIAHMIWRIRKEPDTQRDRFEITALRITGVAFYILVAGLVISSIINIINGIKPHSTLAGVIISSISILVMWLMVYWKVKVGKALKSEPILADADCTRTCIYMSVVLLISSGLYELTGLPYIDTIGTLGIAWFAFREGRECFEKARTRSLSCSCDH
jgi:divalent metal cation (Fe/Co/Zn/Cd) transporter